MHLRDSLNQKYFNLHISSFTLQILIILILILCDHSSHRTFQERCLKIYISKDSSFLKSIKNKYRGSDLIISIQNTKELFNGINPRKKLPTPSKKIAPLSNLITDIIRKTIVVTDCLDL